MSTISGFAGIKYKKQKIIVASLCLIATELINFIFPCDWNNVKPVLENMNLQVVMCRYFYLNSM